MIKDGFRYRVEEQVSDGVSGLSLWGGRCHQHGEAAIMAVPASRREYLPMICTALQERACCWKQKTWLVHCRRRRHGAICLCDTESDGQDQAASTPRPSPMWGPNVGVANLNSVARDVGSKKEFS
jgi:hypothetical protein